MLVLSRMKDQSIILTVGDIKINVMVTELDGTRAKLGIDAPREVKIVREELLKRNAGQK